MLLTLSQSPISTPGKETRVIIIFAERIPDTPEIRSAEDFLLKIQQVGKDQKAPLQFSGKPYEVSFDAHEFFQIDGPATFPGGLLYQSNVAILLRGYVLNFVFTSASQDDLKSHCKTMELLRFEDHGH